MSVGFRGPPGGSPGFREEFSPPNLSFFPPERRGGIRGGGRHRGVGGGGRGDRLRQIHRPPGEKPPGDQFWGNFTFFCVSLAQFDLFLAQFDPFWGRFDPFWLILTYLGLL